jgi:radical SAM domain protein
MEDLYICSPYLSTNEKTGNNRSVLINHLTARAVALGNNEVELLHSRHSPHHISFFLESFGTVVVDRWIQKKLLLPYHTVWEENCATLIEIETSTVCNWNCQYCPHTYHKRQRKYQSLELFKEIIRKASEYGHIRYVSLHGYNEPTIDPHFIDRISIIAAYNLKLALFTNGSGLTKPVLEFLAKSRIVKTIYFNLPSADRNTFILRTGYHHPERILHHIQSAIDMGFKVIISIQGTKEEQLAEASAIEERFPLAGITAIPSFDRCGILKNHYYNNVRLDNRFLKGCGFILTDVHVGLEGEMYLCLEDFYKKNIYANISDGSLKQILQCHDLQILKQKIWGHIPAEKDFICRKCVIMKGLKYTKLK